MAKRSVILWFGNEQTGDCHTAILDQHLLPGICVSSSNPAVYDYIVRELAPTEHAPDEAPITIVYEPLGEVDSLPVRGKVSMRLLAGTTPDKARAIASTLQARVKRLCHLEASVDEST